MPGLDQEKITLDESGDCSVADPIEHRVGRGSSRHQAVGSGNSPPGSFSLEDALHALTLAEKRLFGIQRENNGLKKNNEHLMKALDGASRRAVAAVRVAQHDGLTGLPNRLLLIKRLQQEIGHAAERHRHLALVFIDLDGFKSVNDRYGHQVADRLLSAVGARIAAGVRAKDIACRYGGDEFIALLSNLDDATIAASIAEKIRKHIDESYSIDGKIIHVGASIGLAVYPDDGERYDVLLQHADAAMFRDKSARRKASGLCEIESSAARRMANV